MVRDSCFCDKSYGRNLWTGRSLGHPGPYDCLQEPGKQVYHRCISMMSNLNSVDAKLVPQTVLHHDGQPSTQGSSSMWLIATARLCLDGHTLMLKVICTSNLRRVLAWVYTVDCLLHAALTTSTSKAWQALGPAVLGPLHLGCKCQYLLTLSGRFF